MFPGAPLLVLLIFTTATVFVRAAWALESFQIGIYLLVAACLIAGIRKGKEDLAEGWTAWLVYLIPLWGVLQLVAHTTASSHETREATLRWGSLAGVFFLSQIVGRSRAARHVALHAFLYFEVAMAVLCIAQLFTSRGRVLWVFSSGYPFVFATFPYSNNYVQFVELALPIALWWGLRRGWCSWGYALAAGVLYASVIGSASRAGAALCTAELLVMLGAGLFWSWRQKPGWSLRSTVAMLALAPIVAAVLTLAVGWQRVWQRFFQPDPYGARKEFLLAAVDMMEHRPLTGYGLDTFPEVYQQHAIAALDMYANHAHNDWAEFAADGGIPFLLLVMVPFASAIPAAVRHPWGLGLIAVMLNACVDYPFPRPAVSGWMFAMLGLLFMEKTADRQRLRHTTTPSAAENVASVLELKR
jgi:O-antigen ligase